VGGSSDSTFVTYAGQAIKHRISRPYFIYATSASLPPPLAVGAKKTAVKIFILRACGANSLAEIYIKLFLLLYFPSLSGLLGLGDEKRRNSCERGTRGVLRQY